MNNITDYVKNLSRLLSGKSQKTNKCKINIHTAIVDRGAFNVIKMFKIKIIKISGRTGIQ